MIERCINRLKQWRGFATHYEKRAAYFFAAITLISLMIWLKLTIQTRPKKVFEDHPQKNCYDRDEYPCVKR
ncbi:hypothetical protein [Thermoactinomyces mirandus]|uniref:Transposase n=1 Tax=Thermoactinomyces mirandus TaxID=2756294 RepID=A0A7W1XU24_9BACL|nr:hypothetical protein [Thermoactinomyces mirandus]MBA4603297.1 hypothetical protein [Thermoactinomyces mirandus]